MFTILHITDLHRAADDDITNAELLSALVADHGLFAGNDPSISSPQAIIVSGDIIQGVPLGHADAEAELARQYKVAADFLGDLARVFVGGDRSKVIIVPGNHDIDWNVARASMAEVPPSEVPKNLWRELYHPASKYRWDWSSQQLFVIADAAAYERRFAAFWKFFAEFYVNTEGLLRVTAGADANLYSLDNDRIGVAAFNSCAGNDCFAFHGHIRPEVVAQAHLDLMELGPWQLRIAVWHHDIEGPPYRTDYMDRTIVQGMIGRGFRLGLYGHQHRAQITPQHVDLPIRETMGVASAGSLCAGARELPVGSRRGYSIIEIRDDFRGARVHVREMVVSNLFGRAALLDFGGLSYVDLEWTPPVDAAGREENPDRDHLTVAIGRAEAMLREGDDPNEAVRLLADGGALNDEFGRKLFFEALEAAGDVERLIEFTGEPKSIQELVAGINARIGSQRFPEARALLDQHGPQLSLPETMQQELREKILLNERIKK